MRNKKNVRTRLVNGLRARYRRGKKQGKHHKRSHATGGTSMPAHTEDTTKLKQLIAVQEETYQNVVGEFRLDSLAKENPTKVSQLLSLINNLIENKTDFVVVPDAKANLPFFQDRFEKQPFYVLAIDAPEVSFAFSEMVNSLMDKSRTSLDHKQKFMEKLLIGAEHKATDYNRQLQEHITAIQAKGFTKTSDIIRQLNEQGFKTRRGEDWEVHNFYRAQKQIAKIEASERPTRPQ